MQRVKIPDQLKQAASEFSVAQEKGREATNAANRLKTALKNTVKSVWADMELPIGSYIRLGGIEYRYEATESVVIDNEPILDMFVNGEITREQFLRLVKIDAGEAKNVLGGDVVANLEIKTIGAKLDIRTDALPVEHQDDEYIAVASVVKTKIKRRVFGGGAKPKEAAPVAKRLRRVKLGRK